MVGRIAPQIAEQVEDDRLRHGAPAAAIPVAHLPELLHELDLDAGLLAHLAHRRLQLGLAGVEVALRQAQDTRAVRGAAGGHDHERLLAAHDDAAGGTLLARARGGVLRAQKT